MREIARKPEQDRSELFRATAQAMRVHEAIVEKDFWVCWTLDYLFQESPWQNDLTFKGGTSLSKAYGAIERFSEDIDLVLHWRAIGYSEAEALEGRSGSKQDAFGKAANQRTAEFLAATMAPQLAATLGARAGATVEVTAQEQEVRIIYPRAFSLAAVLPQIKLEIGPLASWVPHEDREIRPYAAVHFPTVFSLPFTNVRTISCERTFWEKATILHQEAHRDAGKALPPRYSRHYYDLYRLSRQPVRDQAFAKPELLAEVVQFKMQFYRSAWAKYELARPGTLRLLPPTHNIDALRKDYASMQAMLFGEIPSFDEILAGLASLEQEINGSARASK